MKRREQARFIRELTESVRADLTELVKAGTVPAEWDGFELRWWLADRFADATLHTKSVPQNRRRFRAYRNEYAVRNL
jgi:hypothetical protein